MQLNPEVWGPIFLVICFIVSALFSARIFNVSIRGCPHTHEFRTHELILYCIIKKFARSLQFQADCFLVIYEYLNSWDLTADTTVWQLTKFMLARLTGFILMGIALKYFYVLDSLMDRLVKCLRRWRSSHQES